MYTTTQGHCTGNTKQVKHLTSLGGTASDPEVTGKEVMDWLSPGTEA